MRQMLLTLFFILMVCAGAARDFDSSRYTHTWAFKGKVLPWILIGSGINYTFGAEYTFGKVHSVGVDFAYNDYSFPNEVSDTTRHEYVSGPRNYTVVRGVFANYRRYLDLQHTFLERPAAKIFGDDMVPYLGVFFRYGKTDTHAERGYQTSTFSYDEWQYSGGVLCGIVTGNFDVNIGPFYKQRYISSVEQGRFGYVTHSSMMPVFGLRLGVNLYLVVAGRNQHYLTRFAVRDGRCIRRFAAGD